MTIDDKGVAEALRGTVSAGFAGNLMQFAILNGADPDLLSTRSGVAVNDLSDLDRRIPFSSYVALMRAAKELCRMPDLALKLGSQGDFREFSVVGLICYASATMGAALQELNRYGELLADIRLETKGPRFQLVSREDGLWMADGNPSAAEFPELTESTWSRFIAETARHFPEARFALEAHLPHPAPDYAAAYEEQWNIPVIFNSSRNALKIDASWLTIELHRPSEYAFAVLSERASALMEDLKRSKTMRGRTEAEVMPFLHRGEIKMEDVAARLGVSRQTLYRQLREEGATFQSVLDGLRHRLALFYLNGKKLSVNETAYLVGFSDPSAFSRAFKRWTGVSPQMHRS